jgi:hypothetical protein
VPDISSLVAPLLAFVGGVFSLYVARKLGLGPVQAEYVSLLRGMSDAQQKRIGDLELQAGKDKDEITRLRQRIGDLEQMVDDLRAEIREMRALRRTKR